MQADTEEDLRVVAFLEQRIRASAHSDELRLYHIDDQGLQIGEMLEGQEGILGGRPQKHRADAALSGVENG